MACPAIRLSIYDSDVFWYVLYDRGEVIDAYDSAPGYFNSPGQAPQGGNVERLQRYSVNGTTVQDLDAILHPKLKTGSTADELIARLRQGQPGLFENHPEKEAEIRRQFAELGAKTGEPEPARYYALADDLMHGLAGKLGVDPTAANGSYRYISQGDNDLTGLLLVEGDKVGPFKPAR